MVGWCAMTSILRARFVSLAFKGSILEDTFKQNISHTPLWSAKPVEENPGLIVNAHLAFLRAGAEIILTSTYVCKQNTRGTLVFQLGG